MDQNTMAGRARLQKKAIWSALLLYLGFLFLTVLIRSAVIGVTWDESHTYMAFGSRADLFSWSTLLDLFGEEHSVANNHWLNSILINLLHRTVHADYNETIMRLPSLLFLFLYIAGIAYGYRKRYFSLTTAVFLISNYYILEYYGLARGYGMANTCVFFAYLALIRWEKSDYRQMKYLNWLMLFISLGVLANTIVLLLYPAIAVIGLYRLIRHRLFPPFFKRCGAILILFLAFSLVMLKYHMNISLGGKPLYTGGEDSFFINVIRGYAWTFISAPKITTGLAVGAAALICGCILFCGRNLPDRNGPMLLILFVLTQIVMQLLMHKGYIATRVLIPFYAFHVLCVQELFTLSLEKLKNRLNRRAKPSALSHLDLAVRCVQAAACVLVIILCVGKTDLHATGDDYVDFKYRTWVEGAELTGIDYPKDILPSASEEFYQHKIENLKQTYTEQMKRISEEE